MYLDWHYDRELREQNLAGKVAERNRYALDGASARRRSLRARAARVLFALAVAVEGREARRVARES